MAGLAFDNQVGAFYTFTDFETYARGGHAGQAVNGVDLNNEFYSLTVDYRTQIVTAIERWNAAQAHYEDNQRILTTFKNSVASQLAEPAVDHQIVDRYKDLAKNCVNAAKLAAQTLTDMFDISERNTYRIGMHPASYAWTLNQVHILQRQKTWFEQEIAGMEARRDPVGRKIPASKFVQRWQKEEADKAALRDGFRYERLYADQLPEASLRWKLMDLFNGGLSQAGIWVQVDENDIVHDRIVKKNSYMDSATWLSSKYWHGNPSDIDARLPLEAHLQQKCWRAANEHFPAIRTWRQDHKNLFVSIYVEFCAQGDLLKLSDYYSTQRSYPEPFLWMVMLRMVESCIVMQQGSIDDPPAPGWRQIVHRDIKPSNVFMDSCQDSSWRHYPVPKMADFGLAFETDAQDPLNPKFYLGSGTAPFLAPEQVPFVNSVTGEPMDEYKMSDCTNVYAICALMFELVGHDEINRQPKFLPGEAPWTTSQRTMMTYTPTLLGLIMSGLVWDPRKRPSSTQLRTALINAIDWLPAAMAQYIKASRAGAPISADWFKLEILPDKYQIGMAAGIAPLLEDEEDDLDDSDDMEEEE
ncbi:unnamed protein product [Zymoseptoria tritici ST99CH_3D7]|uniref:Protein kinase domain-containing protein n=1 Tax=Zymoseptoria tritici (strain ST99CH_3D7) TaxID=1276538 RepID=A0A1X7RQG6_ZYMT9|nr:unnamed protein product [Zymoseptoria tritici ST99CH_3D7]